MFHRQGCQVRKETQAGLSGTDNHGVAPLHDAGLHVSSAGRASASEREIGQVVLRGCSAETGPCCKACRLFPPA